jgi:ornithine--oxo-acid transaminase
MYGPFTPGLVKIPYNNAEALEKVLEERGKHVAAFLVEPIPTRFRQVLPVPVKCFVATMKRFVPIL